ncbi:Putative metabolite transport protein NicT [Paraburkholderia hiiakae]|uniref:Metabolite transport protein NicT n=1 Tax=Paraburkholderia hiiakae TaxID=1081782 RepID=A0ABN7I0K5_9BURK|nr:MFS transporter [Paraburkholderia hiiakae]CAD6544033.1 Putative metabolite transport protein NicT [Paraburkholderia hiiakae]
MSTVQSGTAALSPAGAQHGELYRKVTFRLITIFCLCYFAAYLDRINIGLAKLQMLDALKFSDTIYGLGAGLFFAGYILFEVPSNLILQRVGAKLWIARIMITWGILSGATLFVTTPMQFYIVRFLLGVAEAGFLPGVLLYLTQWYPDARRARIVALFMVGLPLSSMIGSPISGWIMRFFDGAHGLGGWQWLFLIEALPSILLGFAILLWLPNSIESAPWLDAHEKKTLRANLDADPAGNKSHALGKAFVDPKVWALGLIDLCVLLGLYAVSFWLPSILRDTGVKDAYTIGWLMAVPNAVAVIGTLWCGASSDRQRERRWHIVVPFLVAAVALVVAASGTHGTLSTVILFSLVNAGAAAAMPVVWSLPSTFLKGSAAAGGIAFACSIANLGGFGSTYFIGWLRDTFHSQSAGLYGFAVCMVIGSALALSYPKKVVNR